MKVIAIVSQKGGAGKTTVAVHLAVASHLAGYGSAVFDLDPQATAETWGQWREDQPPEVIAAKGATLARNLDRAREAGADLVLLDTPGAAEGAALSAAEVADLVLIPCRPRSFDLASVRQTAALTRSTGKPTFLLFNATAPGRGLRADAREVATGLGLEIAPVWLAERAAFHRATEVGKAAQELEPDGKAAEEVAGLWKWTCLQLNMPASKQVNTKARRRR